MTSLLVCQQLLVPFVRSEPDGHLGNDTTQHSSETLVQTERSLLLHDINTGSDESAGFRLRKISLALPIDRNSHAALTPGAFARRESCIRTLMVSKGWQTRASIIPAPPPAVIR